MSNHTKVKTFLRLISATFAIAFLGATALTGAEYSLADHTIRWTGSTPVKSHTGLLSPKSFAATINDQGSIEALKVVLDMTSIDVTDLEGRSKNRLTTHLLSEDFFYVEKYPDTAFIMEEYKDGKMHGTITIRGVSEPIAIPVTVTGNADAGWKLSGKFTFDRQKFNVNYANAGIIGIAKDKIIRDAVELDIELTLK